jgi:hypothetical protein
VVGINLEAPPLPPHPREVARNHEPNSHGTPVAAHVCETDPQTIEPWATYEFSPNHDPPKRHTSNLHQCQLLQRLLDLRPLRRGHRRGVRRHGLLLRAQRADNGAGHPADVPGEKTVYASTVQLRNSSSATVNMRRPNLGFQIDPVGPIGCSPGGHSNQKPRADRNI